MITGEMEEDLDRIEADLSHPSKSTQKQITISIPEVCKGIANSTAFDMAESLIGTSTLPKDSLHSFNTDLVLMPSLLSSFCEC